MAAAEHQHTDAPGGHWLDPAAEARRQVTEARQLRGEPGKLPEAEHESGPGGELPDEMPF
jgi:hypothetical protein